MGKGITSKQVTIPEEIIEEILCNLPVKSLLRFKCVSKPWRSLISDEYFIKKHLDKSMTVGADNKNMMLILGFNSLKTELLNLGSCSLGDEPIVETNLDIQPVKYVTRILGSCNGLVLLCASNLVVWNPSTGETKHIKRPPSFIGESEQRCTVFGSCSTYGFGYDESNQDYKVVRIKRREPYPTQMYSSTTDSWKEIGNFPKGAPHCCVAKFLKGRLHWLTSRCDIVSLHLSEEKYEKVAWPSSECSSHPYNYHPGLEIYHPGLEILGGYLCLNYFDRQMDMHVWVMTDYGVGESWTGIWTLCHHNVGAFMSVKPLYLMKNGDIIVTDGPDIVVYRGKNELRRARVGTPNGVTHQPIVCVETLVSPFGHDNDDR